MYKYKFTVCTPTYNSEKLIHRVYESLTKQTFKDFEWIVVNDGSNDNTKKIINQWKQEKPFFPISYFEFSENKGKMSAMNLAIEKAQGKLFQVIDADDRIKPHALERLLEVWNIFPKEKQQKLKGVVALCEDQHGNLVGDKFPCSSPCTMSMYDMRFKYKVKGDKIGFTRTDLIKQYPFNTTVDKFVPENHVWLDMGIHYKQVYINDILRVYYVNQENHTSIMDNAKGKKWIKGERFYKQKLINDFFPHIKGNYWFKLKNCATYLSASLAIKIPVKQFIFSDIKRLRILLLLLLPAAYLLYKFVYPIKCKYKSK